MRFDYCLRSIVACSVEYILRNTYLKNVDIYQKKAYVYLENSCRNFIIDKGFSAAGSECFVLA